MADHHAELEEMDEIIARCGQVLQWLHQHPNGGIAQIRNDLLEDAHFMDVYQAYFEEHPDAPDLQQVNDHQELRNAIRAFRDWEDDQREALEEEIEAELVGDHGPEDLDALLAAQPPQLFHNAHHAPGAAAGVLAHQDAAHNAGVVGQANQAPLQPHNAAGVPHHMVPPPLNLGAIHFFGEAAPHPPLNQNVMDEWHGFNQAIGFVDEDSDEEEEEPHPPAHYDDDEMDGRGRRGSGKEVHCLKPNACGQWF